MKTRSPLAIGFGMTLLATSVSACAGTYGKSDSTQVLTDGSGMTVYTFDKDVPGNGKSTCYGGCAAKWPPVQSLDSEVDGITTITRNDGGRQVTYNESPLYYFVGDTKPGDRVGDGLGNVWHIVKVASKRTSYPSSGYGYSSGNGGY